jgi:hypothetical protein
MEINEEKEVTMEEFFQLCENDEGRYQIDTPNGWQNIGDIIKKKNKECYNLITKNGLELGCSNDHYVMTNNGWKKAEDINVEKDTIKTVSGYQDIVAKEYIGIEDTFDLEVLSEEHSYYSNEMVSHNTGKSLVAKAISSLYTMPLLRLDFGRLFGSLVGDSEKNIKDVIKTAENIAPCLLWIDEIEKGISGTGSSNMTDGGTTSRVVSTFLTWMQEKEKPVFLVCTANNQNLIPPEFMRAGRFDEIFFIDLPNIQERKEVYSVLLKKYKRNPELFDLEKLAEVTTNYSGAEIEKSIEIALFEGYSDKKREIITKDILMSISTFRPLFETRKEDLEEIRNWAKEKGCTMANDPETYADKEKPSFDNLDLK